MVFTKASQVPTGTKPLFALQLRRILGHTIVGLRSVAKERYQWRGGEDCRDHFRDVGTAAPNIGFAREGVACDRFASHRGEK